MISNFELQLVCVSVPTSALRIRGTVVNELNWTVCTVFLAPRVLVASHVMLLSKSCEGTQQRDPESPALFLDSKQDLIDSLESKINLWYLNDGNLSDDYRTVLKDLKKIVEAERTLGLKIKPTKSEIFFPGDITEKRRSTILAYFQKLCPGIRTPKKNELIILGSTLGPKSQADLSEKN